MEEEKTYKRDFTNQTLYVPGQSIFMNARFFALIPIMLTIVLASGCVNQSAGNQTSITGSCRMSLCDCSCHTGPITEDTGALCGINCARYGNGIVDCETINDTCTPVYDKELQAKYACIDLCQSAQSKNITLDNGPCLSNSNEWNVTDWSCDIAHVPRTTADSASGNQCPAYQNGSVTHFVELTTDCTFIRSV